MSGFITIERDLFEDDFFDNEPMSEREAWIWMNANARWKGGRHKVGGAMIDVPRGTFMATLREMQSKFMWRSDTKVRNFLKRLEKDGKIERTAVGQRNASKTHVTICDYDENQASERTKNAPETHRERTENAVKKQGNKVTTSSNEEGGKRAPSEAAQIHTLLSQWASPDASSDFIAYRKKLRKPLTVVAAKRVAASLADLFNAGHDPNDALGMAQEKGWLSVKLDWYENAKGKENDNRNSTAQRTTRGHSGAGGTHDSLFNGFAQSAMQPDRTSATHESDGFGADGSGNTSMDCGPRSDDAGTVLYLANAGYGHG